MHETNLRRIGCAILVNSQGHLLLQQRDDIPGIIQPGKIGMFGGHCEPEETGLDCAVREIAEETSYPFPRDRFIPLRTYEGRDPERPDGELAASIFTVQVADERLSITEGSLFVANLSRADEFRPRLTPIAVMALAAYLARS